ncbi:hypothetical protein [Mesorhizobium sp. M2A.F.Ca.ET.039.01.1.1]|uniref:hypothetical protein n=1 Tax=Mesorhizobium sp. M2A.F.Ca.ET.039.01.1.1 TaxID=2496746 RepID=UPI000FCB4833|nr:hypothetical protein [Mesorhizobium sp. M2A.F.Ca.ET.039.01.1.1]RWX72521.1 hypothetical protein EOA24_00580 [Mesorhizobium sp. M2A.F.Ca.ET.039.01.1.1]
MRDQAPEFTVFDKLREVEKEVAYRHRVYRRLISAGKMKTAEATRRIGIMTAIAEDYRRAQAAEPDLFKRSVVGGGQ